MRAAQREARARKAANARWEKHNAEKQTREALHGPPAGRRLTVAGEAPAAGMVADPTFMRLSRMCGLMVAAGRTGDEQVREFNELLRPVHERARAALLEERSGGPCSPPAIEALAECWELIDRIAPRAQRYLKPGDDLAAWAGRKVSRH